MAKQRLVVQRARASGGGLRFRAVLEATRKGKGRSMNLIAFVTRGRVSKASTKRTGRADLAGQLQFQIKRGGGKKAIKGAFIANAGRSAKRLCTMRLACFTGPSRHFPTRRETTSGFRQFCDVVGSK